MFGSRKLDEAGSAGYHLLMPDQQPTASDQTQSADPTVAEMLVSPPRAAVRARWGELVFLIALSIYAVLALLAHRFAYFAWDIELARHIQAVSMPGFGTLMIGVSLLGNAPLSWALVSLVGIALIRLGLRAEGIISISCAVTGSILNTLFKLWIGRPRPTVELVNVAGSFKHDSFPSGHVVFFVTFFGFAVFLTYVLLKPGLLRRALLTVFGLLIGLVGVSRVYLGAHWPSDVVGAYLAAGMWLVIWIEIYRRIKARGNKELRIAN